MVIVVRSGKILGCSCLCRIFGMWRAHQSVKTIATDLLSGYGRRRVLPRFVLGTEIPPCGLIGSERNARWS